MNDSLAAGSQKSAFVPQDSGVELGLGEDLQPISMWLLSLMPLHHSLHCLITYVDIHVLAYIIVCEYKQSYNNDTLIFRCI